MPMSSVKTKVTLKIELVMCIVLLLQSSYSHIRLVLALVVLSNIRFLTNLELTCSFQHFKRRTVGKFGSVYCL